MRGTHMAKDLRTYLEQLKRSLPNHIKVVDQEVDRKWEITGFIEKIRKDLRFPDFPGVLFSNVKGSKLPVLINLCASYERLALSIDATVKTMVPEFAKREAKAVPPVEVDRRHAPVKEVIWTGNQIDPDRLPTVWHNELDSGCYVDAGVALLKDPDNGKVNAGIYRHEVQNSKELGFMSNPAHHASYILRRMRELGKIGRAHV